MSLFDEAKIDFYALLNRGPLLERLQPDPAVRRAVLWDNPRSLLGLPRASPLT